MKCHYIAPLIYKYCDGEMDDLVAQAVRTHLKKCPRCHGMYVRAKEQTTLLRESLALIEPEVGFLNRLLEAVRENIFVRKQYQSTGYIDYEKRFAFHVQGHEPDAWSQALSSMEWRELWLTISHNSHNFYFNLTMASERKISG